MTTTAPMMKNMPEESRRKAGCERAGAACRIQVKKLLAQRPSRAGQIGGLPADRIGIAHSHPVKEPVKEWTGRRLGRPA
jgi:hypothetical protein